MIDQSLTSIRPISSSPIFDTAKEKFEAAETAAKEASAGIAQTLIALENKLRDLGLRVDHPASMVGVVANWSTLVELRQHSDGIKKINVPALKLSITMESKTVVKES